jgi:hypothetical protein
VQGDLGRRVVHPDLGGDCLLIRGARTWITNDYEHNGLRHNGLRVESTGFSAA